MALAASQAPAAPTFSRSSTTIRSAVFLPTPEICESDLTSPPATAPRKAVTEMPLRMFSAVLGPMPETVWTSSRNMFRSASVMKPYSRWASSRMTSWVSSFTGSPGAGSLSNDDSGISTS